MNSSTGVPLGAVHPSTGIDMPAAEHIAPHLPQPPAWTGETLSTRVRTRARFALGAVRARTRPVPPPVRVASELIAAHGSAVLGGPFCGLFYDPACVRHTTYAPKLIGSYEQELHAVFAELIAERPRHFVDIGSAEGFYAAGMARAVPGLRVTAYDILPGARHLTARLARRNGVADRVDVRAECTHAELAALDPAGTVLLCDIEGAELALMDPARAPVLREMTLVIEIHDFVDPLISATLRERFGADQITEISTEPRDPSLYPALSVLAPEDRDVALDEVRPGSMTWMVVRPG